MLQKNILKKANFYCNNPSFKFPKIQLEIFTAKIRVLKFSDFHSDNTDEVIRVIAN